jgi:hypothetical protein
VRPFRDNSEDPELPFQLGVFGEPFSYRGSGAGGKKVVQNVVNLTF